MSEVHAAVADNFTETQSRLNRLPLSGHSGMISKDER
jgi:hypothetical protein